MSGTPNSVERGTGEGAGRRAMGRLWLPRRRVQAAVLAVLVVAAFSAWRVERQVGQARLELRLAEAAIAGQDFGELAERAPDLLSLAARHAAGEGRWRDVAALYEDHAAHLPPALLEAAEVELGLNRAVDEEAPAEDAEGSRGETEPDMAPVEPPPASAFERRLRRAQQVDASGVQQLLFDRRGRPLGSIGDDRSLTLEEDLPAGLVPVELATHLLPPALQPPGLAAAGPGAKARDQQVLALARLSGLRGDRQPLPEGMECRFDLADVRTVAEVDQVPDRAFRETEPSGQRRVADALRAHCAAKRDFGGHQYRQRH